MDRYGIYVSRIGDIVFTDLSNYSWRSQTKKSVVIPGGSVHPSFVATCCADPVLVFTTKDLARYLAASGSIQTGYVVDSAGAEPTATSLIQFQRRNELGSTFYATGQSAHVVGTSGRGFLHPTEITADQDDENGVQVTFEYLNLAADGMVTPITWSDVATLTGTPAFNSMYYLGPVMIGVHGSSTLEVPGIQSVRIRPGIDFRAPRGDGHVWSVVGSIHAILPEIRITTLSPEGDANILGNPFARAFTSSNQAWNIYFRRGVHGGTRFADNAAQHICVTALTGENTTEEVTVNQLDNARFEIVIRPTGGISMNASQAISPV